MKISLISGLLFFSLLVVSAQACINPNLKKDNGITLNPFGGWLIINGTKYDGSEIEYNLGIKNTNNQGLLVSLQPSSNIKDYVSSEPVFVEANSIKNMTLKIWVGGKSLYDTIEINYVCEDGTPQFLLTYINFEVMGKGILPPPSSSCDSSGLNGCYSGLYRDYYCSNNQLQYKETCNTGCCQSFGGSMAFCTSDKTKCIAPDPNEKIDVEINSPENKTYGNANILINVSTNSTAKNIYYAFNNNMFIRACQYCNSYAKQYMAKEGLNELIIRAEDYFGNYVDKEVAFTVDSKKPVIRSIEPKNSTYVKGVTNFIVYYDEDSVKNISLFYGKEGSMNEYVLNNCPSGRNQRCDIQIDLSSYDGQNIQYYFVVRDEVNSSISKVNKVYVDKTIPTITILSPSGIFNNRNVPFNININEVAVSLEYSDNGGRFTRLCRNCNYYSKNFSFNDGIHNLVFKATDKAGNEGYASVAFTVDSKKPVIRNIEPKNSTYVKGVTNFIVYYDEDSVKSISLFYGKDGSMNEYVLNNCPSGRNQACTASVDLTKYNGGIIKYYFVVRSALYEQKSATNSIIVDNTAPIVTINSPLNNTYTSRTIRLNAIVNKPVKLEYSDNGSLFRRMCINCVSYNYMSSFSYGTHNLTIKATDYAGNEGYASVVFTVKTY